MKEAMLYRVENDVVNCYLCSRYCKIPNHQRGFCRVRENLNGKLYTLVYDKVVSANPDPIQKKPLFHFAPGSMAFSIATPGCNFRCDFCCNWVISQSKNIAGESIPPERLVEMAIDSGCQGMSYTYTEPTIFFELAYDTAKIAQREKLFNMFVTNGYMTEEAVDTISPYLNAVTVDFKGSGNTDFYRKHCQVFDVEPIYKTLEACKEKKIFIEITNLIIPEIGDYKDDFKKLCRWIVEKLGDETPLHLLAFHPNYKITDISATPVRLIDESIRMAESEGLKHVYSGNIPGHRNENTYCPRCGNMVIERYSIFLRENKLKKGVCPYCGYKLNVIEWPTSSDPVPA